MVPSGFTILHVLKCPHVYWFAFQTLAKNTGSNILKMQFHQKNAHNFILSPGFGFMKHEYFFRPKIMVDLFFFLIIFFFFNKCTSIKRSMIACIVKIGGCDSHAFTPLGANWAHLIEYVLTRLTRLPEAWKHACHVPLPLKFEQFSARGWTLCKDERRGPT